MKIAAFGLKSSDIYYMNIGRIVYYTGIPLPAKNSKALYIRRLAKGQGPLLISIIY
jgi:hypothetical protein